MRLVLRGVLETTVANSVVYVTAITSPQSAAAFRFTAATGLISGVDDETDPMCAAVFKLTSTPPS